MRGDSEKEKGICYFINTHRLKQILTFKNKERPVKIILFVFWFFIALLLVLNFGLSYKGKTIIQ